MLDSIGPWITLAALILSATTLWLGARRSAVETLVLQVNSLKQEVDHLKEHSERCERQLEELRSTNQWLTEEIREAREERRNRGGWFKR